MGGEPRLDYRFGAGKAAGNVLGPVSDVVSKVSGLASTHVDPSAFGKLCPWLPVVFNAVQDAAYEALVAQAKGLEDSAEAFLVSDAGMVTADGDASALFGALSAYGRSA